MQGVSEAKWASDLQAGHCAAQDMLKIIIIIEIIMLIIIIMHAQA